MKKDMPLEGLRWSRDSGSALCVTPQTAVLGRAGGGNSCRIVGKPFKRHSSRTVNTVFLTLGALPPSIR